MPGAGGFAISGYSAWKNREVSQHAREDARLAAEIQQVFLEYRRIYGSPRIHAVLKERGVQTSRKRVLRLMRASGDQRSGEALAQAHHAERPSCSLCPQYAQPGIRGGATQYQMGHGYQSGRNG